MNKILLLSTAIILLVFFMVFSVSAATDAQKTIGDLDAPVTIEKYTDFECPFCNRWYQQTYPSIEEDYIVNGKVKIVYKHFPLSFHTNAMNAAIASECAAEQNEFEEYIDKLYNGRLTESYLFRYARELGLDMGDFEYCFEDDDSRDIVEDDQDEGQDRGVRGTPAFFINGDLLSGAQPYGEFERLIEKHLEDEEVEPIELFNDRIDCESCLNNNKCLPLGHRIQIGERNKYCSLSNTLNNQKEIGVNCQNNYECLSNQCSNGLCIDINAEIKENRGLIERIIKFFGDLF